MKKESSSRQGDSVRESTIVNSDFQFSMCNPLRLAFRYIEDVFYVIHSSDYKYVFAEGQGFSKIGYSPDEIIGKYPKDFFPKKYAAIIEHSLSKAFSGIESCFTIPFKKELFKATAIPISDDEAEIKYVMVLVDNITNMKHTIDELTRHRQILASIVDTQQEMICRFQGDSTLTFANRAYASVIGLKEIELIGRKITDFIPKRYQKEFNGKIKSLNSTNHSIEYMYHSGVGAKTKWQEWKFDAIFDQQGTIIEYQAIGRDVTNQMEANESERMHSGFQKLVTEISTNFVSAEIDKIEETIDTVLTDVGAFFNADRAYLFRYSKDFSFMSNTNEWCKPGISKQKELFHHYPTNSATWWNSKILSNQYIHIPNTKRMPEESKQESNEFQKLGLKSLIGLPVSSKGKIWGFFGFDCVKTPKKWTTDEIEYLKIIANLIAEVLYKQEIEQDLYNQNQLYAVLNRIAQRYINLPSDQLSFAIHSALEDLAKLVHADRAYIFDYDWENMVCNNTYEWCENGISPQIEELQEVPLEMISWWVENHRKGNTLYIEDVLALSEDDGVRQILEPQDVKSLIAFPILNGMECKGFVGFDSVKNKHIYSEKEQKLLNFFAQLLVNVSNRIELENDLRAEKIKADQANKAKSEFLANMSHEIRTPLNGVIGFTELIQKTKLDSVQHQYVLNIVSSGYTLLNVINDILDFSKIEAGKLELDPDNVDLIDLVERAADIVKIQSAKKGLEFLLNIAPDIPTQVRVDQLRLNQILVNLLSNAVKFTHKGEIELKVTWLKLDDTNARFSFSIKDTGIGIDRNHSHKLFKAFSQADTSTSRNYGGTGLGLVIANALAGMMNSKIEFTSEKGKGSIFYFTVDLPFIDKVNFKEHIDLSTINKVMIIDDNEHNRTILHDTLAYWGISSTLCENGVDALKVSSESGPFDVIIVDYNMPILNGLDTVNMLLNQRSVDPENSPTILMLSSSDDSEIVAESKKIGINYTMVKPVKVHEFLSCLKKIASRSIPLKTKTHEKKQSEIIKDITLAAQTKILVAEDNYMNMVLIRELLSIIAPEATILTATNGIEAVIAVEKIKPDVVVMDVQMPELDGVHATIRIRENPDSLIAETPIIALTAGALKNERSRCLEAGMNAFLTKPVLLDELRNALFRFIPDSLKLQPVKQANRDIEEIQHFNSQRLIDNLGNDKKAFRRLISLSLTSLPDKINSLRNAISENSRTDIKHIAHSIKGSALNLFFGEIASIADQIEQITNKSDLKKVSQLMNTLETEWIAVEKLLRTHMK